ncbi:hypothetical protein ACVXZ4_08305 [Lacisediminihabitans sp. FW035]
MTKLVLKPGTDENGPRATRYVRASSAVDTTSDETVRHDPRAAAKTNRLSS